MLTVHIAGAFNNCLDAALLHDAIPSRIPPVNPLINTTNFHIPLRGVCHKGVLSCSSSWNCITQLKIHDLSNHTNLKRWLCRSRDSIAPDNEYRSLRNIAITLFTCYRNFVERGGGDNQKEFINAGVNAYALGCSDEGLRRELIELKGSGVEIETMQTYGRRVYILVEHHIHHDPVYTATNYHSVVTCTCSVRRDVATLERLLCHHSKCVLYSRNGVAPSEDTANIANGCSRPS